MKVKRCFKLLFVSLLLASAAWAAPATDFKTVTQKMLDAWATLDMANVTPYYAKEPDRVFYDLAPMKYTGWSEYVDGFKKVSADFSAARLRMNDDFKVDQHGGTLAWTSFTFHVDFDMKDGSKLPLDGRWTDVWQKFGKNWLIVHEHVSAPLPPPASTAGQPLYKRLGGYDALGAVTDDFVKRLATDPQLGKFFAGHSTDSLKRIRQLVVDQLCEATGGPCYYIGRTMKAAHSGMGITEDDWNVAGKHLVETLDHFNVPQKEKDEVLAAITSLKTDIVSPPSQ